MDTHQHARDLLKKLGPGYMMDTAYDAAWVARVNDDSLGERALEWIISHQLPDGSWGAETPCHYHDRLICTLAATIALARRGHATDSPRLQRARSALTETIIPRLQRDPVGETIGFEMIVPTLLAEAYELGIVSRSQAGKALNGLEQYRAVKLAALPSKITKQVTLAFSAEMAGKDVHLLDLDDLQEENGSVGYSPSATAYFVSEVCPDRRALEYLHSVVAADGGVPNVAPLNIFERGWVLWNLSLAGISIDEFQSHLDFLEQAWTPDGVGFAAGYTVKDSDDCGLVYDLLSRFRRSVDLAWVSNFEEDDYFRCFELEANPSSSSNIHVLGAFKQTGYGPQHPSVQKIVRFLQRIRIANLFWLDKWHASPYYPTAHAIINLEAMTDQKDLIEDAIYWILMTQETDGGWGYYNQSTAEETAYCLQALAFCQRQACINSRLMRIARDALQQGVDWLVKHAEPPYPPLWIGKCLYSPQLVVRSAVLSALQMAADA